MKIWAYVALGVMIVGVLGGIGVAIHEYSSVKAENSALVEQNKAWQKANGVLAEKVKHAGDQIKGLNETMHKSNQLSVNKLEELYAQLTAQQQDLRQLKELAENDEATREFLRDHFPRAVYCFMFPRACPAAGSGNGEGTDRGAGATASTVQGGSESAGAGGGADR